MKPLLLFFTLSLVTLYASAQNDKQSVDFVRAVFHEKNISYTDSLSHGTIDEMKSYFDEQFKRNYFEALKITQAEKNYIDNQLALSKQFTWKPGLFENSTLIALDTIKRLFYKIDSTGHKRFYTHYATVYSFGKPIFLRSHTLCFFYEESNCGTFCGNSGHFSVYIKRKRGWVLWSSIYDWVS